MIEMFVNDKLEAAAGVRQPLEAYAKDHPDDAGDERRVPGDPAGDGHAERARAAGAKYLAGFVEEMKARASSPMRSSAAARSRWWRRANSLQAAPRILFPRRTCGER